MPGHSAKTCRICAVIVVGLYAPTAEAVAHPTDGLAALEEARPSFVATEPTPHPLAVEYPLAEPEPVGARLVHHLMVGHGVMVAPGCDDYRKQPRTGRWPNHIAGCSAICA
jgi:hypothetical protein